MRIINGICYPDNETKEIKVLKVEAEKDFILKLLFNTGETKTFDFKSMLDKSAFIPLSDKNIFNAVSLEHGVPIWQNGEIDISPSYLYNHSNLS